MRREHCGHVCSRFGNVKAAWAAGYALTVVVESVNNLGGNVGLLVFDSPKFWAEDRSTALKDITVPALGRLTLRAGLLYQQ